MNISPILLVMTTTAVSFKKFSKEWMLLFIFFNILLHSLLVIILVDKSIYKLIRLIILEIEMPVDRPVTRKLVVLALVLLSIWFFQRTFIADVTVHPRVVLVLVKILLLGHFVGHKLRMHTFESNRFGVFGRLLFLGEQLGLTGLLLQMQR